MKHCFTCGSDKTYRNQWPRGLCKKCYNKFTNPKRIRVWFKKKVIMLKENPRIGVCSRCGKTNCKTDIHHIVYHDDDPLKDTIELCTPCHKHIHHSK